ncbi:MAG: HDOD domain-containing protein, partial [Pseudomonadota bacterium]
MKRILFVDDEPNVLSGLRRSLFQQRGKWDMHFVESGAAALEALAGSEPFDVLVSDMRMPEMSGEELLEAVAAEYPRVARLVLSGHAERASAVRAAGVAHQFLAKPCDPDALKRAVSRTCYLRSQLNDRGVLKAVAGLGQLPSLPRIYRDVAAEVKSDDPTLEKVANLISADLGMSAKVLQLVNSAYFGLGRRVEDVRNAASLLGLDVIHDLVLANSAFAALGGEVDEQALEAEWRHGFRVATVDRK